MDKGSPLCNDFLTDFLTMFQNDVPQRQIGKSFIFLLLQSIVSLNHSRTTQGASVYKKQEYKSKMDRFLIRWHSLKIIIDQ